MKRLLFLVFALAIAAHAQTPAASAFHTITTSWTAPVGWTGSGASAPCSSTVTNFCVSGYTETITPPAGVTGTAIVTMTATSYAWSPGGALYCGTYNVSIVANWLNGSGVAVASAPVTASAVVSCPFTASPATGLTTKIS